MLLGTAAALVPHRTTQRLQPLSNNVVDGTASAPRRAVVYRGEEDIDVDAVAASLISRGLEPDVVDVDRLAAALAQPDVAAIYAGRYASHEALDTLEPTKPLYRYEKSAGAFKLDRRCEASDAPKWVSLEVESEEKCLERNGWNFLTPEEPATWGAPPCLDAEEFVVDQDGIRDAVVEHGVAFVRDMIPTDVLKRCASIVDQRWAEIETALSEKTPPLLLNGIDRFEFNEIVHRSDGRFDMKVPEEIRSFLAEAPWVPAVHALLGPDCVPLYDSAIVSVPGAKTQDMHSDNGHLFPHAPEHIASPHCVTVICPLVDVDADNGPTEFWPGSHYESVAKELFEERARTGAHIPSKSSLQLAGSVGDAILFDTRTVHRGMANSGKAKRPILYIAYARPWYTEGTKNFPDETLLS